MRPARIALCIPAYNATGTLSRLFDSINAQTSAFDEVWLYDDCSTDATAMQAAEFGATVVRGEKNMGCSGGKNVLLSRIQSEWVHFHDADDELNPEFVERAKRRIADSEFDVLLFDYEQVDEESRQTISRSHFADSSILDDTSAYMLRETVNNGGVYSTAMLRNCGGFDDDAAVRFNEDRAFHLRLAGQNARFAVEPYVGCRFYYNKNSMSAANQVKC
ncbi:MAG: glycosyltransferase family 2 protein, partial [Methylococcales bacterium]